MCLPNRNARARIRRGLTLVELMIASAILAIMVGALSGLALTVQTANEHGSGQNLATQHARVTLERIERSLHAAHANASFPGFAVFSDSVGGWTFPDTLVVWQPSGAPANPDGLPLFSELVVYSPDPNDAHRLLEIRVPSDARTVPPLEDTSAWVWELAGFKMNPAAQRVQLTNLLRTASATADPNALRGAIRFEVRYLPSRDDWDDYQTGNKDWDELPWVQNIYGSQSGLRQSWCAFEIQLVPHDDGSTVGVSEQNAVPFFGTAAIYYELPK